MFFFLISSLNRLKFVFDVSVTLGYLGKNTYWNETLIPLSMRHELQEHIKLQSQ